MIMELNNDVFRSIPADDFGLINVTFAEVDAKTEVNLHYLCIGNLLWNSCTKCMYLMRNEPF
jgi:hypothetical protein